MIPVLIDFGAARLLVAQHSQTVATLLTPGYAPCEQYSNKGQGPWTDIYALAATLYDAITGAPPPEGLERVVQDNCVPITEAGRGRYDPRFLAAIEWGMSPLPQHRPQSVAQWVEAFDPYLEEDEVVAAGTSDRPNRLSWRGWFGRG